MVGYSLMCMGYLAPGQYPTSNIKEASGTVCISLRLSVDTTYYNSYMQIIPFF